MSSLPRYLAMIGGILSACVGLNALRLLILLGFDPQFTPIDVACVVQAPFMTGLSLLIARALRARRQQPRALLTTVASLSFGFFGSIFVLMPVAQGLWRVGAWREYAGELTQVLLIGCYFLGCALALHVCRLYIQRDAVSRSLLPSGLIPALWLIPALALYLPEIVLSLLNVDWKPYTDDAYKRTQHFGYGLNAIAVGLVLITLSLRCARMLRRPPYESLGLTSKESGIVQPLP